MADANKKMSLLGLTTLVMVNMMGSGIILLPSSMAQLGAVSLLSWIVTAIGSMCIAYCFAQCGIYCTRPGGMSAYTEEAHGKKRRSLEQGCKGGTSITPRRCFPDHFAP